MGTYSDPGLAARYDGARGLPSETVAMWMEVLKESLLQNRIQHIIDLGCGTGRFTAALAETFDCTVIAVDSSDQMLNQRAVTENVSWVRGGAERIPLAEESVDLIWMSQVFHHLAEPEAACDEVRHVLRKGGIFAIRNGTKESDRDLLWARFFPELKQQPSYAVSRSEIVDVAMRSGFQRIAVSEVDQFFVSSCEDYYGRIRMRALSPLLKISDEAFQEGLQRLRRWIDSQPEDQPVYEPLDFFVFRKP
jgi:ubiquinone/menaquinone biosynthesis C-methylase UbiE